MPKLAMVSQFCKQAQLSAVYLFGCVALVVLAGLRLDCRFQLAYFQRCRSAENRTVSGDPEACNDERPIAQVDLVASQLELLVPRLQKTKAAETARTATHVEILTLSAFARSMHRS